MRLRVCVSVFAAVLICCPAALANNQTVTLDLSNTFTPSTVTVFQGETITWNNTGGFHNVKFDDGSYTQPASPQSAPWTVTRTYRRNPQQVRPEWPDFGCTADTSHIQIGNENYLLSPEGLLMPARKGQNPPDLKYFK